jgi:hypothetical protein
MCATEKSDVNKLSRSSRRSNRLRLTEFSSRKLELTEKIFESSFSKKFICNLWECNVSFYLIHQNKGIGRELPSCSDHANTKVHMMSGGIPTGKTYLWFALKWNMIAALFLLLYFMLLSEGIWH